MDKDIRVSMIDPKSCDITSFFSLAPDICIVISSISPRARDPLGTWLQAVSLVASERQLTQSNIELQTLHGFLGSP